MSNVKNKDSLFVVMRHDFSGKDVVVALTKTYEKASDLEGEYTQLFIDKGFKDDEFYFYTTACTYYDQ